MIPTVNALLKGVQEKNVIYSRSTFTVCESVQHVQKNVGSRSNWIDSANKKTKQQEGIVIRTVSFSRHFQSPHWFVSIRT